MGKAVASGGVHLALFEKKNRRSGALRVLADIHTLEISTEKAFKIFSRGIR